MRQKSFFLPFFVMSIKLDNFLAISNTAAVIKVRKVCALFEKTWHVEYFRVSEYVFKC